MDISSPVWRRAGWERWIRTGGWILFLQGGVSTFFLQGKRLDAFWNEVEHPVSFQQLMWNCLLGETHLRGNCLYQPWGELWLPGLTRRRPSFQQPESGSFCLIEDGAREPEEEEIEKVPRRASEQTRSDEMFSGNGLCLFVWKARNMIT